MKTPRFSSLTVFLAGTTLALLFVFGLQALSSDAKLQESLSQVGQELLPEAVAGFNTNSMDVISFYSAYLTWPRSTTLKAEDTTAQTLEIAMKSNSSNLPVVITDINGDGLADYLYRQYNGSSATYYGIFLNNGNLGSNWVYKCAVKNDGSYYGDCAG